ncbi:hypothetical protein UQ68_01165 [Listeria seeligeri]|uniref:Uncharacterized protein n=1 Tax=Listeria seeligeri TaxID=1640 RepID=A0ABR5EBK1_LISSE|nr:hypothetical protein UQ68_01165 [Listeria seeligeri]
MMGHVNTDQERVELAKKEYSKLELKKEVNISTYNREKKIGIISQVNNKPTGEQSFIITDKYTPPTAASTERNKVKELTILYIGSTAADIGNRDVPLKD